ncbi:hypothetical protein DERF_002998 [Dermatophagoides farinae]|uniref:Uncharacterized protein n=1 Tax=Dermatophagoides farinae TaxID=6954 RepID=A0A922LB22_DERFA|nr:hypothetical protein DERF_002998 [Dermatophagoides farinae]
METFNKPVRRELCLALNSCIFDNIVTRMVSTLFANTYEAAIVAWPQSFTSASGENQRIDHSDE